MTNIKDEIRDWCKDKNGLVRIPFILYFSYVLVKSLTSPDYASLLDRLNLGIHELGHLVFSCGGKFLAIAGGTIAQLLAPVYGFYNFIKQKDYFAAVLCFGWLATNFFGIARYAADARAQALPLVSPFNSGEEIIHDWNYLLTQTGLLPFEGVVAFFFRLGGVVSMLICLGVGGWMIVQMFSPSAERERP